MNTLFRNILTASFHGSIVILAVMLLRLVLKKTPRKYRSFPTKPESLRDDPKSIQDPVWRDCGC